MSGLLWTTVTLAGATAVIAVSIGSLLAVLLARTTVPGRSAYAVCLLALISMPLFVQVSAWDAALGRSAPYHRATSWELPTVLTGWRAAVFVHAAAAIPWVALIIGIGLRDSERELEEAALVEGSAWLAFRHVTLPRAASFAGLAALLVALFTASEIVVTDYYQVRTAAEVIYTSLALGDEAPAILRAVLPTLLLQAGLVLVSIGWARRMQWTGSGSRRRPGWMYSLGRWRGAASLLIATLMLGLGGVPLAHLLLRAGLVVSPAQGQLRRSWSAGRLWDVTWGALAEFQSEFSGTAILASLSATLAITLASSWAWLACRHRPIALVTPLLLAMLWALPAPLLGIGTIAVLNHPAFPLGNWLYNETLFAPVGVLVLRSLPLVTLLLWYGLASYPRRLHELAAVDGAGTWYVLTRMALPLHPWLWPAAWLAAWAIAAGELSASILVMPPSVRTVAIRAFGLLHAGVDDQLAGLCLLAIMGFVVLAAGIGFSVARGVK